jgi:uncharacterized protein YjaG (DUF416 family)
VGKSSLTGSLKYDEAALAARLAASEGWQKAAFALACAQRLLPLYLKYCAVTGEGDTSFATQTAASLWQALEGGTLAPDELQKLLERAEGLVPPGEAVGVVIWHWYAADAMAALIYAIKCQQRDLTQEAVWAARQAIESASRFVEIRDGRDAKTPDDMRRLDSDPVVQAELGRQAADLDVLVGSDRREAKIMRVREAAERSPVIVVEG